MYAVLLLLATGLIVSNVYPVTQTVTATALANAHLAAWNLGNWIGTALAMATTLLCLYGAISLIEAVATVRGKVARTRLLKKVGLWVLYLVGTLLCGVIVYHGVLATATPPFALVSAAVWVFVMGVVLSLIESPDFSYDRVIRGMQLQTGRRQNGRWSSITWGNDWISPAQETHFLTFGNTGRGKSTFMLMNLCAVASRITLQPDYRGVVYDPKNNLVAILQKIGTPHYLLNPLDERSVGWRIWEDIVNVAQAAELAKTLIPDTEDAKDQHWLKAARLLIGGVIRVFIDRYQRTGHTWDLRDVLNATEGVETLRAILEQLSENRSLLEYLKPGTGERNDYIITLQTNLQQFAVIASLQHQASETISLKAFLQSEVILHLGSDNEMGHVLVEWYGLLIKLLTDMHLTMTPSDTRRTFFFFDEASDGSRFFGEPIIRLLTLGRGYGCRVFLYIQNRAGMVRKFGQHEATEIVGLCRWKAIVGGVDYDTAHWFAKEVIGERLQAVATTTDVKKAPIEQINSAKDRTEKGVTHTVQNRLTILPQELMESNMPPTGPETGLTGLFLGGETGLHWHTYIWEEVLKRQVQVDIKTTDREGYKRIPLDSPRYNLKPWTDDERLALGLSIEL